MNRMKSVSLDELDNADEQWYSEENPGPSQGDNPAFSRWRQASKHFLRGTYYRGPRSYDRNVEMATNATRTVTRPNPENPSLVETESAQRGTGGQITYSHDYSHQQESRQALAPSSSGSNCYRSCTYLAPYR